MTMDSSIQTSPEAQPPKYENFFSRLAGVYFSPRDAFREIGVSPRVLIPIIVLVVVSALVGFYVSRNIDMEALVAGQLEQAVAQGRMTQEQADQQATVIAKYAGLQFIIIAPLASLLMVLLIAAGFKLISSLMSVENTFKAVFAVTLYAMLAVSIVQSALTVFVLYLKGPEGMDASSVNSLVASSLRALISGLMGDDALPGFFMKLAGFVDLFAIWIIALLAVGYAAVSRKLKTSRAAFWLVAVYAVIAVIWAAISASLGR
jgi:hypothetical protein